MGLGWGQTLPVLALTSPVIPPLAEENDQARWGESGCPANPPNAPASRAVRQIAETLCEHPVALAQRQKAKADMGENNLRPCLR